MWSDIRLNKLFFSFTLSVFVSVSATAQSDSIKRDFTIIEPDENYILLFKFDSMAYKDNCPCFTNKSNRCQLIKGSAIDLLFSAEGESHFMSKSEILATDYILAPENFYFEEGQNLVISAYSAPNKRYLVYNRTRNKDESRNYVFRGNIIQSPGTCYRFNLLRWLRIRRKVPSENEIRKDKFAEFISKKEY